MDSLSLGMEDSVFNSKILFDVTERRSFPEEHTTDPQIFTTHDWLLLTLCSIWPEPLLVIPLKQPRLVCNIIYQPKDGDCDCV
jgi:hypothetical protein